MASLEPALLRGWLARAEAFGLRAGAVVPEPLLLPRPADDTDPVQVLASPLVLVGAQTLRLELAARSLDSRARAMLRDALPGAAGDAGALARRLREVREPQVFAAATGALFAAVAARAGTHLVELEYQHGDRVRAVVFHPGPDDIDALRAALAADGWTLVEGGSTEAPGGLRTGLVLEPSA